MRNVIKRACLMILAVSSFAVCASNDAKLIYYGWDSPGTTRFVEEYETVKDLPFDGYVIAVDGKDENGPFQGGMLWQTRRFSEAGFDAAMADAEKIAEIVDRTGVELFVILWANPGSIDWFDDAAWDDFMHNLRMITRVVKRAKAKGFLFDPEPYVAASRPFGFIPAKGRSFAETTAIVRQRGADFMQVIAEEYPDMVFLTMGMWCWTYHHNTAFDTATDFSALLSANDWYGLLPAFCDGLLETLPDEMRFINATEAAYHFRTPMQFLEAMRNQRGRGSVAERMVAPELRDKFRRNVEGGFGLFLDPFIEKKDAETAEDYFADAIKYTDQYVWIYAEKGKYFPKGNGSIPNTPMWDDAIPGLTDAIRSARNVFGDAQGENLARNSAMDNVEGYGSWLGDNETGKLGHDPVGGVEGGALTLTGISSGCYMQSLPAKPGEVYQVSVFGKVSGAANGKLEVRWKNPEGGWLHSGRHSSYFYRNNDWEEGKFVVEVPEGAGYLTVLFLSNKGETTEDVFSVDNLKIIKAR